MQEQNFHVNSFIGGLVGRLVSTVASGTREGSVSRQQNGTKCCPRFATAVALLLKELCCPIAMIRRSDKSIRYTFYIWRLESIIKTCFLQNKKTSVRQCSCKYRSYRYLTKIKRLQPFPLQTMTSISKYDRNVGKISLVIDSHKDAKSAFVSTV